MIVQNPKKQTIEEIKKEFKGYCVLIVDRDVNERGTTLAGRVIVYDKWMKDVWEQMETISQEDYPGLWDSWDLTESEGYVYSGVSEVIHV